MSYIIADDNCCSISTSLLKYNKICLFHEKGSNLIWESVITDSVEIASITDLFNSLDLRQDSGGQPINSDRYVITFYENNNEIATWWVGGDLTTASTTFGGGNHKIQNDDFNINYFERFNDSTTLPPSEMPNDFSFSIDFGTYGKCNIDTYNNTLTKDLVSAGSETIDFIIPEEVMKEIYEAFIEYRIFELPDDINATVDKIDGASYKMQTPSEKYSILYTCNNEVRTVVCEDGGPWLAETGPPESRNRLVAFVGFVTEYIYNTTDYQNMPPIEGGYD